MSLLFICLFIMFWQTVRIDVYALLILHGSYALLAHMQVRAIDIKPDSYNCGWGSPVGDSYFSDSTPKVPLTHIFCGQIQKNKAQGYHALSIPPTGGVGVPPVCARNDKELTGMFES